MAGRSTLSNAERRQPSSLWNGRVLSFSSSSAIAALSSSSEKNVRLRRHARIHRCARSTPPSTFDLGAPWKAVPASLCKSGPAQLSLRLEALEAAQEVTNELKHFEN
jgi:hypothetical protein